MLHIVCTPKPYTYLIVYNVLHTQGVLHTNSYCIPHHLYLPVCDKQCAVFRHGKDIVRIYRHKLIIYYIIHAIQLRHLCM